MAAEESQGGFDTSKLSRAKSLDAMEGAVTWMPSKDKKEARRPLPKFVCAKEVLQSQEDSLKKDLELASTAFKRIQDVIGRRVTCDDAKRPGNYEKNRFKSVFPNDSTRVRIRQRSSVRQPQQQQQSPPPEEDYINANMLEYPLAGSSPLQYIATQGPLKTTVHDFWTMVWEQHVSVIVMLTDLQDDLGRDACTQYWPSAGSMTSNEFQIDCHQIDVCGDFNITTPYLSDITAMPPEPPRVVYHVQFMPWPDFGIPANPQMILTLHQCVRSLQRRTNEHAPLLVHCTAGLGRTGVYILVDVLLRQITFNQVPNAEAVLCVLREQRCGLVQTEEQYAFSLRVALAQVVEDAKLDGSRPSSFH
uniref:Protein tyrosine phosphatase n=1 Tax=Monosiga ovata TaxID=81526 RepID=E5RKE9_9EUKA|nr:protein tyrosine phosphatase [Monosiga ovata]